MSNRTNLNWNYPENLNNTLVQNRHYDTAAIPTCNDLASLETKPDAIHQKPSKSYKTVFFSLLIVLWILGTAFLPILSAHLVFRHLKSCFIVMSFCLTICYIINFLLFVI